MNFYTTVLTQLGVHAFNTQQGLEQYILNAIGQPLEKLEKATKQMWQNRLSSIKNNPHVAKLFNNVVPNNPGIYFFITVTGESEEAFQEILDLYSLRDKIVHRSVPTENWNYSFPERLLTLYVIDLQEAG